MLELEHARLSDQGPERENNEDFMAFYSPEDPEIGDSKGCLFVIADGVGGNRAGEVASQQASQHLIERYYQINRKPDRALKESFNYANLKVCDMGHSRPEYRRMETTLSALSLVGQEAIIGHIGDSRIYRIRQGEIRQLTNDHSEVGELMRMRLITPEEARHHPRRNVITRSLGSELLIQADFRVEPLLVDDIFVMCTDGLWEPVEDNEILSAVSRNTPEDACRCLIRQALEQGASDNISVQVIKLRKLGEPSEPAKNGLLKRTLRFLGA